MKMLESTRKSFNYLEVREFLEDIFFHLSDHNESVVNNKCTDSDKKLFDTTNYEKRNELLGRCRKILNNLEHFLIDEEKFNSENSMVKKSSIKNNDDLPYLNMSAGKKASSKKTKPPPPPQLPQPILSTEVIVSDYVDVMNLNSDSDNDEGISEPDAINFNKKLDDSFDKKLNIKSKDDVNIYDRCSVNTTNTTSLTTNSIIPISSASIVTLSSDQLNCPFSGLPAAHLEIKHVQKCGYLLKIERRLFFGQKKNYYAGILDGWLLLYSGGKTDLKPSICLNLINCSVQLTNLPPTPPSSTAFVVNTSLSTPTADHGSSPATPVAHQPQPTPSSSSLLPPPTISVIPTTNIKSKRDLEFFIQLNINSTVLQSSSTSLSTSSASPSLSSSATASLSQDNNRRKRYRFQVPSQTDHLDWMNEIQKYAGNSKSVIEVRQTCSSFSRKLPTPPTSATVELSASSSSSSSTTPQSIQSSSIDSTNSTDYENRSIINSYNNKRSSQQQTIDEKLSLKTESIYEEPNEMLNYSIESLPKITINNSNDLNKYSTIDYGRQFNYDIPKSPPKCVDEYQPCHDDDKNLILPVTNDSKLSVTSAISPSSSPSSSLLLIKQKKNDKFKDMQSLLSTQLTVTSRSSPLSPSSSQQQQEPPPPKKTKSNKSWFLSRLTILSSNNSNLDNSNCKTKVTTSNDNNKNSVKINKKPTQSSPTMTTAPTTQQIKINATKTGGKINMIINQLEANGHLSHFQKSSCGGTNKSGGGGGGGTRRNHKDDHNYEAVEISKK